ncbi:MAG: AraC family transcriptional regulator [bacterium]|nr:AraC family transcriptional regulator [bacterium]
MLRVLAHVQRHLDEALSPNDLARVACFSPHHFHRIFRGMLGESVMGHIRRLRLERAAWQLKVGDRPVTRVAFDVGYEAHEAFTRAFGAMFGLSPSAFRERHRKLDYPASPSGVHFDPDGSAPRLEEREMTAFDDNVRIVDEPARRAVFLRHVGPYDEVGETWDRLMTWAGPRGLIGAGTQMLGLCHDDPEITPADKVRYDSCLVVAGAVEVEGPFGLVDIPGGEYAVYRHVGPYSDLGRSYIELLGRWLPASGRAAVDVACVERYWNDPENTPPQELETDLCVLLEPR